MGAAAGRQRNNEVQLSPIRPTRSRFYLHWNSPDVSGTRPPPRFGATIVSYENKVYLFGGATSTEGTQSTEYDNNVYIFDTETMDWEKAVTSGPQPPGRALHSAVVVDKNMYIFGGYDGRMNLASMFILNLETLEWSMPAITGFSPAARFESAMVAVGKLIYLIGGATSFTWRTDVYVFDTERLEWSWVPVIGTPPSGRCAHTICVYKHWIILYGGSRSKKRLKDGFQFDTWTHNWTQLPNSPSRRAAHNALMNDDGLMLVLGGHTGKRACSTPWIFDADSKMWTQPVISGAAPSPKSYSSSCTIGRRVVIFGGCDVQSQTSSNDIHFIQEGIPTLKQFCVAYIQSHRRRVGSLAILPLELRELFDPSSHSRVTNAI